MNHSALAFVTGALELVPSFFPAARYHQRVPLVVPVVRQLPRVEGLPEYRRPRSVLGPPVMMLPRAKAHSLIQGVCCSMVIAICLLELLLHLLDSRPRPHILQLQRGQVGAASQVDCLLRQDEES